MAIRLIQKTLSLESDLDTPVGLFLRLVGEGKGMLFESAEVDGRWGRHSIIATDFALELACRKGLLAVDFHDPVFLPLQRHAGKPFIQGLRECIADIEALPAPSTDLPPITRALYGYLGYGLAGLFEPKLAAALRPEDAEATLVLPRSVIIFDHGYNRITQLDLHRADNGSQLPIIPLAGERLAPFPAHPESRLTGKANYVDAVKRVAERLRDGEGIQITLSTPFSAPLAESPFAVYRRLRRASPSPYMFYMRFDNGALLGSSPEVMVTCDENRLRLSPAAGTRPRSVDFAHDALFGDELLEDPREKVEHAILVDLGRSDLGRIAKPGSVTLERFMEVEGFPHAMRLASRIGADLADGKDALDVLAATFPAGSVSGAPKARAMEIIAEEEGAPRGPYAGAIGWIGLDREACNLDFGITIRSLWVRDGRIHWQSGSGIRHDSIPEKEWNECLAKAEDIRKVVFADSHVEERSGELEATARKTPENVTHAEPVQMAAVIEELAQGHDLPASIAGEVFGRLMNGELTPTQAGAFLLGLRAKGESPAEVGAAVEAILDRAVPVPPVRGPVIDVVGTGGDGKFSFNCSTATALTLAGMGYKVLKHGNRSVSSKSGSADVLEQLGIPLDTAPEDVPCTLERERFVFLFAPSYHPAFRHVMPIRRELGVRTLFNLLGPLVNPARPTHHLLGVPRKDMLSLVAETLARRGTEAGAVVCGAGGYDEITPIGPASVIFVRDAHTIPAELDPASYGFSPCAEADLAVSGPEDAAQMLRQVLHGKGPKPMRDMLTLNLGLALYLLDGSPKTGDAAGYDVAAMDGFMKQARQAVASGAGRRFANA